MLNKAGPLATGFRGDPPIVVALLTCDQAMLGMPPFAAGKPSLVGIFDRIASLASPFQHILTVYIATMDFQTPFKLSIRLVKPSEGPGSQGTLLSETEVAAPNVPGETAQTFVSSIVTFAEVGRYEVQAYGNDSYLAHKPLFITLATIQEQPG